MVLIVLRNLHLTCPETTHIFVKNKPLSLSQLDIFSFSFSFFLPLSNHPFIPALTFYFSPASNLQFFFWVPSFWSSICDNQHLLRTPQVCPFVAVPHHPDAHHQLAALQYVSTCSSYPNLHSVKSELFIASCHGCDALWLAGHAATPQGPNGFGLEAQ